MSDIWPWPLACLSRRVFHAPRNCMRAMAITEVPIASIPYLIARSSDELPRAKARQSLRITQLPDTNVAGINNGFWARVRPERGPIGVVAQLKSRIVSPLRRPPPDSVRHRPPDAATCGRSWKAWGCRLCGCDAHRATSLWSQRPLQLCHLRRMIDEARDGLGACRAQGGSNGHQLHRERQGGVH
jgi:hypothetical protein